MMKIHRKLLVAVQKKSNEDTLRHVCKSLLEQGVSSETLLQEFESIRILPDLDETYEDTILDVMDSLSGWCSPAYSLVS